MRISRSNQNRVRGLLAGLAMMALVPSAFAASTWSDLSSQCDTDISGTAGNSLGCGVGTNALPVPLVDVRLGAQAFSTTGAGSTFAAASVYNTGAGGEGLGVLNTAAGDSTRIDNANDTDAVRLKFTNAAGTQDANFNLTHITLTNSPVQPAALDFSLLAWVGPGTPGAIVGTDASIAASPTSLLNAGWTNIGSFYGVPSGVSQDISGDTVGIFSSYWLVAAFNTSFGPPDDGNADFFSVAAISGGLDPNANFKPAQVPEPGSLALFGIALAGMAAVRRRQNKRA